MTSSMQWAARSAPAERNRLALRARISFVPIPLLPLVLGAFLYGKRAQTLARRGTPVARWRLALFGLGAALVLIALVSPIATLGEQESFGFHMVQHLLLGDLAPLCIVAG